MRNELPEFYFFVLPDTGQLVIIKRNERGYYPSEWSTDDKARNQEIADFQNRKLGITPAQRQAMECGSMFGWKSPGTSPQLYLNKAVYAGSDYVKGHLRHPTMSILYPVDSVLCRYEVAGETVHYLELTGLSQNLLGKDSDITLLPDLVRGRPLLPVQVEQAENGTFTFLLEQGSYALEKEMNAAYRITARVQVGPTEYVMGEHPTAPSQFVTWERTPANEDDRGRNYYWGHYYTAREAMIEDFGDRAKQAFDFQQRRNSPHREENMER